MKPRIFHSDLSGRYYYCTRYKDLGEGKFEANRKIDVTDEINRILENYRAQLAKKNLIVSR